MGRNRKIGNKIIDTTVLMLYHQHSQTYLNRQSDYIKISYNDKINKQIERLKNSAALRESAYLTANQIALNARMFVINKNLLQGVWRNTLYASNPIDNFKIYLNPKIEYSQETKTIQQICLSMPFLSFQIQRSSKIEITFKNNNQQYEKKQINNFQASVIQHCMDHIDGRSAWLMSKGNFKIDTMYYDCFQKTQFLMRQYSLRIKNMLQKGQSYNNLLAMYQNYFQLKQYQIIKQNYQARIKKSYIEQIQKYKQSIKIK